LNNPIPTGGAMMIFLTHQTEKRNNLIPESLSINQKLRRIGKQRTFQGVSVIKGEIKHLYYLIDSLKQQK
jgi:hypothetical protein